MPENKPTVETSANLKTILAIKVKRLRKQRGLTLGEVSQAAGVSQSYLAEIEGGKKYPKPDRIAQIAAALNCSYDELTSSRLGHDFEELRSFINGPILRDFPFAFLGIPASDVVKLLARSPLEVTALIRTLSEVARQYDIGTEHFLYAALRSYLELTKNTYPDIDVAAERFAETLTRGRKGLRLNKALRKWVSSNGIDTIDEQSLASRPALAQFRSVLLNGTPTRLLVNPLLSESQKTFVLAREAGYRVLGLNVRSFTAPPDREGSFEQVRNDFQASYFAGALLMPRKTFSKDLRAFFGRTTWQPAVLLSLLEKYRVTPETLMHRISQLMPAEFGLPIHFLKFTEEHSRFRLAKQVNLSGLPTLSGVYANEQYCRRWLATRLLIEFRRIEQGNDHIAPHVGVQFSRFASTSEEYFNFGIALHQPLRSEMAISLIVGCKVDDHLSGVIRFAADPSVPRMIVGGTCERCGLGPELCSVRAAPPTIYIQEAARQEQLRELELLERHHW